jgi:hypothetical protein
MRPQFSSSIEIPHLPISTKLAKQLIHFSRNSFELPFGRIPMLWLEIQAMRVTCEDQFVLSA